MGGFAKLIAPAAGKILARLGDLEAGEVAAKTFKSLESGFQGSEPGKDLANILKNDYIPNLHQVHTKLVQIEMAKPDHLQRNPGAVLAEAKTLARNHALGPNDANGAALIAAVDKLPNLNPAQKLAEQQKLADYTHMFLRDTRENGGGKFSQFKKNIRYNKENPVKIKTGAIYQAPNKLERATVGFTSRFMLPAIAVPHIGTLFNYALNTPTQDLARGLSDVLSNYGNVKQFALDTGVLNGTITDAWTVRYMGRRGLVADLTSNPEFGRIVNQITHQPGFNALREFTISLGAASGKHTIERMADKLIQSNGADRFATLQLKNMGIDTADLLAKGKLDPDMLRKGIFHFVDNQVFLDNTMQRSFYAQANPYTRMASMYHGYITRQGRLIKDSVMNAGRYAKTGTGEGALQAAQVFGTLAILFPTVGVGLKTLEMYSRGQFQDATPVEDFKNLAGFNGWSAAGLEALDGYSHVAAFGIATDYYRAGLRHSLAASFAGPIGNEVFNLGQDTIHAVHSFDPDDPNKSFAYLERDVLEDTLPDNLGKLIAHQVLPTQTEQRRRNPKLGKLKRSKSFKGLSKLN